MRFFKGILGLLRKSGSKKLPAKYERSVQDPWRALDKGVDPTL